MVINVGQKSVGERQEPVTEVKRLWRQYVSSQPAQKLF